MQGLKAQLLGGHLHYTLHNQHYTNAQRRLYEMHKTWSMRVVSYQREGRLVPMAARGLRARSVMLARGQMMEWHSTRTREELLIALSGVVNVEVASVASRRRRARLITGQCVFLPRETMHRVVNDSRTNAHYIYVTAPTR